MTILTAIVMQLVFGINVAKAYCEAEVLEVCKHDWDVHNKAECDAKWQTDTDDRVNRTLKKSVKDIEQDIEYQKSELNRYLKGNDKHREFHVSQFKAALCSSNVALAKLTNKTSTSNASSTNNSTSNQSSSSASNQKAMRQSTGNQSASNQSANNQPNQNTSNTPKPDPMEEMGNILGGVTANQTSSNSNDLSKMSGNQLIDIATDAESRGDYARAYLAELQLSKDPNPKLARQGLRQVSFRLRTGQGVAINRTESHRLAVQAANLGDVTAHSYVCADYLNGKGVDENHRKALDYCLFAAERGDMKAQGNLGWLYESGEGIQHSPKLSDEWTCKAAAQGEPTALNNVKKAKIKCN